MVSQEQFPIGVNTKQPIAAGIDSIDKAYFPRALYAYAYLWNEASKWPDKAIIKNFYLYLLLCINVSLNFLNLDFGVEAVIPQIYNVPHIINEQNVFRTFERKSKTIYLYF